MITQRFGILCIVCTLWHSDGVLQAQGAALTPPKLYQSIPTRDIRTDQPNASEPIPIEIIEQPVQRSIEPPNQPGMFHQSVRPTITRSMAVDIEQHFGPTSEFELPKRVDLTKYLPKPGKQTRNDCIAWAIAYCAYSCQIGQERRRGPSMESDVFSPAFIFDKLSTNGDPLYAVQAIDYVKRFGCASQATMSGIDSGPTPRAFTEASCFRTLRNERARNLGEIKTYLSEGYPVILIVHMGDDFRSDASPSDVYRWAVERVKKDDFHAVTAVGYDDDKNALMLMNSWGTQWKNDGLCWASYDSFSSISERDWCAEAHVIGVKRTAPYSVSMQAASPGRPAFGGSSRFGRRTFSLKADRKVYENGAVITPNNWQIDDLACSQDSLFVLGRDQTIYRFNDDDGWLSWTHLNAGTMSGNHVTMLAADESNLLHALTDDHQLFQYDQDRNDWSLVSLAGSGVKTVDLRMIREKIHATTSDGSVFVRGDDHHWSLAP